MALQVALADTNVGVPAPTAYARIVGFNFNPINGEAMVAVDIFATAAARTAGKSPVSGGVYRGIVGVDLPNLDAPLAGVRAVLYGWLKTLPNFAGAIDV